MNLFLLEKERPSGERKLNLEKERPSGERKLNLEMEGSKN